MFSWNNLITWISLDLLLWLEILPVLYTLKFNSVSANNTLGSDLDSESQCALVFTTTIGEREREKHGCDNCSKHSKCVCRVRAYVCCMHKWVCVYVYTVHTPRHLKRVGWIWFHMTLYHCFQDFPSLLLASRALSCCKHKNGRLVLFHEITNRSNYLPVPKL